MGFASSLGVAKVGVDALWEIMEYRRDTGTGWSVWGGRRKNNNKPCSLQ